MLGGQLGGDTRPPSLQSQPPTPQPPGPRGHEFSSEAPGLRSRSACPFCRLPSWYPDLQRDPPLAPVCPHAGPARGWRVPKHSVWGQSSGGAPEVPDHRFRSPPGSLYPHWDPSLAAGLDGDTSVASVWQPSCSLVLAAWGFFGCCFLAFFRFQRAEGVHPFPVAVGIDGALLPSSGWRLPIPPAGPRASLDMAAGCLATGSPCWPHRTHAGLLQPP